MIYYLTLYLRFEFEDGTYALSNATYPLNDIVNREQYDSLIQMSIDTMEEYGKKKVKNCHEIFKEEFDNDNSKESMINVQYGG